MINVRPLCPSYSVTGMNLLSSGSVRHPVIMEPLNLVLDGFQKTVLGLMRDLWSPPHPPTTDGFRQFLQYSTVERKDEGVFQTLVLVIITGVYTVR